MSWCCVVGELLNTYVLNLHVCHTDWAHRPCDSRLTHCDNILRWRSSLLLLYGITNLTTMCVTEHFLKVFKEICSTNFVNEISKSHLYFFKAHAQYFKLTKNCNERNWIKHKQVRSKVSIVLSVTTFSRHAPRCACGVYLRQQNNRCTGGECDSEQ